MCATDYFLIELHERHFSFLDRLLLYGIILAEKRNNLAAEVFLKAITALYPLFTEGWAILHLYYLRTEYFPGNCDPIEHPCHLIERIFFYQLSGADLSIRIAEQTLHDPNRDTLGMEVIEDEPLAWSTIHCPSSRMYLTVAVFLLKLNLYDVRY